MSKRPSLDVEQSPNKKLSKYKMKEKNWIYSGSDILFRVMFCYALSFSSKLPPPPTETGGTQQLPFDYIHSHYFFFLNILSIFLVFPTKEDTIPPLFDSRFHPWAQYFTESPDRTYDSRVSARSSPTSSV